LPISLRFLGASFDDFADPDETLQRKTLDLLYRMTNPVNVEFIADKLIDFLSQTTDVFLRMVLTKRVCAIAERYAPNNAWYIKTITKLFEVSGDLVSQDVAHQLMSLIAEGTGESDEADMLLRQNAVEIYVALLRDKPVGSLPRILLETMAWCLGEYGYLSAVSTLDDVLLQLCTLTRTHKAKLATSTRRFLVMAIMKLVAQSGSCPPHAAGILDDLTKSRDVDVQQRCCEFQNLLTHCPSLLPSILPVDASAEDVDVDENLSFLNSYVQDSLNNGARPYQKPDDDDDDDYGGTNGSVEASSGFKMTPYEKPQAPSHAMLAMSGIGSAGRSSQASVSLPPGAHGAGGSALPAGGGPPQVEANAVLNLNTRNVTNKWGRGGLNTGGGAGAGTPAAVPAATPAPSAPASAWEATATTTASSSYTSTSYATPAPPPAPVKTAEQLEKERLAAALFGGMVPGAPPPPPPPPQPPSAPSARHVNNPAPPPAPAAALAPEVDLLDMGLWDSQPASTAPPVLDAVPPPQPPAPIVETVSDDEDNVVTSGSSATAPPPPLPPSVDPFADAGLLGDVPEPPPLSTLSLSSSSKFEFNGSTMLPLKITTPQFGQQWGSCPATAPISVSASKIATLDQFMTLCADAGSHKVEAISVSNEGICAGMFGAGTNIVLIHGKVTPLGAANSKVDVTIKSSDQALCGALAIYLQTLMR
jgi:AP-4 complex subunit epsilon-1